MRYVALIALVNFVALLFLDDLVGFNLVGGAAGAIIAVVFGIPFAIIVGIPILWAARRISAGSALALLPLGGLAGAVTPIVVSSLFGMLPTVSSVAVGTVLGMMSSGIWWVFVERNPERRAYYD